MTKKLFMWSVLLEGNPPFLAMGVVSAKTGFDAMDQAQQWCREQHQGLPLSHLQAEEIPFKLCKPLLKTAVPDRMISLRELVSGWIFGRERRIQLVVKRYWQAYDTAAERRVGIVNGLGALQVARADLLKRRSEMKEVCGRICSLSPHPNWLPEILENEDLLDFMRFCRKHDFPLDSGADASFAIQLFYGRIAVRDDEPLI